nr:amino acid permease [uncultured Chitinophaga sp.]
MSDQPKSFRRSFGLLDATMVVAGSMIGSGIFIVSADITRNTGSAGWLVLIWAITGLLTLTAALSYGELSGMFPKAGGQYVYLKEAFGPLPAFLFGWSFLTIIQAGSIAAVGVAFAKFSAYIFPALSEKNVIAHLGFTTISSAQLTAILLIVFLTFINTRGVKEGKVIQTVFTLTKIAALIGLIIFGLMAASRHTWTANWQSGFSLGKLEAGHSQLLPYAGFTVMGAIAGSMVGSLFSSDSWNNVTFIAGEIKRPERNIGLSLFLGTLMVTAIYVLTNLMYLGVMPLQEIAFAENDRVGVAASRYIFGAKGTVIIAVLLMVSTFGCNNGLILSGARVCYCMAKDGLFFSQLGTLNKNAVPGKALWLQCIWASMLCLSGRYGQLLEYVIFVVLLFYILTIAGIFRLRRQRPDIPRPYKAVGYPWLPLLYIISAAIICLALLVYKPLYTWPGLGIVLLGIPVYGWYRRARPQQVAASRNGQLVKFLVMITVSGGVSAHATAQQKTTKALYEQTSEINNLMVPYYADKGNLERYYFIENSPERRERLKELYNGYLQRLQEIDFEPLPAGSRVDYILFRRELQEQLRLLETEAQQCHQLDAWFSFAGDIYRIEKARRRGGRPDAAGVAAVYHQAALFIREKEKQREGSHTPDIHLLRRAAGTTRGLQAALESIHTFYNGYDPQYSWWAAGPYRELDTALKSYATLWAKKISTAPGGKDDGSGITGHPIGREELVRQLQYEMIPYSPEELIDIANKEFAYCDAEMLKAAADMGLGKDWKQALEKIKNSYVPAGEQPQAIMKLYHESISFLKEHELLTIPPMAEETWRMIMMTPERQLVNPFFTGGEELSISYPTDSMSEADKLMSMRGNNPHLSRATVHHELIAGHGLQQFMTSRYKTYRHFETPFWIEGWALYWEMLLWDMKFARSPEDRVGMLFWRMHRCARIIFSLNYHLGKWTPQQCVDFLVNRVGHERANAEGEVRRSFAGDYSPLYQVAYMIGGLQFMALKQELVDSGKMTYRQFHDAILEENMLPVELIRALLTGKTITKDFKTSWRFYQR